MKINFKYIFYVWCSIVPLFAVLMDLILTTIIGENNGENRMNFDQAVIDQIIYFSVWVALYTSFYGILNWIHLHKNNMPNWITGKNSLTFVVTLNLFIFLTYNSTLIILGSEGVAGFSCWYKILKSILEHMISPIVIIIYYFTFRSEKIGTREYATKYSLYCLILPSIYLTFVIGRAILLTNFSSGEQIYIPFPYTQLDPGQVGYPMVVTFTLLSICGVVGVAILMNYLNNIRWKAIS